MHNLRGISIDFSPDFQDSLQGKLFLILARKRNRGGATNSRLQIGANFTQSSGWTCASSAISGGTGYNRLPKKNCVNY